jgi:hypothetical protein
VAFVFILKIGFGDNNLKNDPSVIGYLKKKFYAFSKI